LDLLQFDIKFQRYSAEWAPCDGYDVDLIAWGQFHEKPSPKTVSEILQERHLLLPQQVFFAKGHHFRSIWGLYKGFDS